ncbi:FIG00566442: hypothetical protein [hydrothermal vent metagenome]|uniref:FlgD/Vpr Ig-like domain-containing protein n=1 Tax=hydrothermal vent metagenome TaxID=652676 RepID=A0A3B0WAY0_9ZZZZ
MKLLIRKMLGRLIGVLPIFLLLAGVSHAQVNIDFNNYTIESYGGSGQDKNPTVSIEDQGATLRIVGNGWKKIALPYTVTANTVIEFGFQSSAQGEVHGIGFDTDNGISGGRTFKVYGTQNWGISAFDDYASSQPNVKNYVIPVGQHFTGDMLYLTFTNDHDVASPTAESVFSNVKVYENTGSNINFNNYTIESYGGSGQDKNPTVTIEDQGATLRIVGNGWKKIALPYTVTANTIIEFDFQSTAQGEVHGIGFDTDNGISGGRTFKVYGTQNWGIATFDDYAGSQPNVKSYIIPVGQHFTGNMLYLTFTNDHDVASPTAESIFFNVKIYENTGGGGTEVSGAITADTTWTLANSPYVVVNTVWVSSGAKLTIEPGVQVKFNGNYMLRVDGELDAQGTINNMIRFTSNQATPQAEDWQYIQPNSSEGSIIRYVVIEYAKFGIFSYSGLVTVENSVIQNNIQGFYLLGTESLPVIKNNKIINNTKYGIEVSSSTITALSFNFNSLYNNGLYNFYSNAANESLTVNAKNNWWGTTDVSAIANSIYDSQESSGLATVAFFPYLDGPEGNPVGGVGPVSGNMTIDTTWPKLASPIIVTRDTFIDAGVTLTIEDGVEVRFDGNTKLEVNGTLNMLGTKERPVKFTSNQSSPTAGDWKGLRLNNDSGVWQYFQVEYAENGVSIAPGLEMTFEKSTFTNNQNGMVLECPIASGCPITLKDNMFENNTNMNLRTDRLGTNAASITVNAENNWWGTVDAGQVRAKIFDNEDNANNPVVDSFPYLDGPDGQGVGGGFARGIITSDTTWTLEASPVNIIENVYVNSGVTLTIEPGVEVRFNGNYYLRVYGAMLAEGTENARIKFTSSKASPAANDWASIVLGNGSIIRYATIEYGNIGLSVSDSPLIENSIIQNNNNGIDLGISSAEVNNNIILNNLNYGIRVTPANYGIEVTPTITNNKIIRNDRGIHIFNGNITPVNPIINNNFIAENVSYNLYITNSGDTSTQIIDAENNWWGSALVSEIEASIYDNQDNLLFPIVDYEPFKGESDVIQVTGVSIEPFDVQLPLVGTLSIKYTIDKDVDVTVKVYDLKNNQLVRTLLDNQARLAGQYSESWDGKDDFGQSLNGAHYFSISAKESSSGQIGEYNPLFVTGPVDIINGSVTASLNPYRGEQITFSYDLVVPAVVRLGIGIPGDMAPKKAFLESFQGVSNTGFWDGRDDNGDIVAGASNYIIYGVAHLVPDNFIFFSKELNIKISVIIADPHGIYPFYQEYTTITYDLFEALTVTVEIVSPSGSVVKTLVNAQAQSGGSYSVVWDGTGNNGGIIADQGEYKIRVIGVDGNGNTTSRDGYIGVFR